MMAQARARAGAQVRGRIEIWQTAGVKRVLWLLLAAFVLMWGGVALRVGVESGPAPAALAEPRSGDAEPSAERRVAARVAERSEVPGEAPGAQPVARAPGTAQPLRTEAPRASEPRASASAAPGSLARSKRARAASASDPAASDSESEVPEELVGELGEGVLSPDYVEIETDYASEPRDGPSATLEEQRILALLRPHPLGKQVALVNCQDRVCRIVLETRSQRAFEELLAVPGIAAATGIGPNTPYSLRSGQLSVYYRRAGGAAE